MGFRQAEGKFVLFGYHEVVAGFLPEELPGLEVHGPKLGIEELVRNLLFNARKSHRRRARANAEDRILQVISQRGAWISFGQHLAKLGTIILEIQEK